ncbi:MAG: bacteriocin system transporter, ATP-binding protein [Verrucomicrobiales bacterium]|nr:bacteriocin system transporter, ATP-binding protein [Verrucomicrobiales bacterium]
MTFGLKAIFESEGKSEIIGGNLPFLLDNPDSVWLVERGHIEIFSVRIENENPVGTRFHFCSVGAESLLFGMDLAAYEIGRGFLAVGMVNTRLFRLSLTRFRQAAADDPDQEGAAACIDQWVRALSTGLGRDIHTRTEFMLDHENVLRVEGNKSFRSRKGVYWIAHEGGDLVFLGMEDIAAKGTAELFPITEDTWVQTLEPVTLSGFRTNKLLRQPTIWAALSYFYETILKCERINKRLAEVDEFNRLQDRFSAGRKAAHRSLEELASVFQARPSVDSSAIDDPLFNACDLVAKNRGITLRPPRELVKGETVRDPLGLIVKTSGVRMRKVSLKGSWWREEGGPFLVYTGESLTPAAALPVGQNGYILVDPKTRASTPLTNTVAATIHESGYTFYRSFGENVITARKVFAFGIHGLGKDFTILMLMGLGGGLLGILPPMATGLLFDSIIPSAQQAQLLQITAGLILIALSIGIFEFTRGVALLRIEGKMDNNVQAAVVDRLFSLPIPFFRQFSSGDLADRANGISQIRQSISATVGNSIISNIFALFNLLLLFYYDTKLALVGVVLILVTGIFTLFCSVLQIRYQRQIMEMQGRISGQIFQFLNGITKLRVAGAEVLAFSKWATLFAAQKRIAIKSRSVTNRISVFNAGFPVLSSAVFFWVVVYWSDEPHLSPGSFLAFFAAFTVFLGSMLAMILSIISALNVVPLFERVRPLLSTQPEISAVKIHPGELSGRIELSRISFRYTPDGPLVLKDLSFEIKPREFIAIVGPSGSGKSTLLRLFLGFDQPEAGAILFDGQELRELDVGVIRRQIGIVLQTSKLMAGNILFNIIGSLPLTQEDAWEAARMAGLEEDIKRLPMGMHTVVSTSSAVFSGGQQQRLMIARAIAFKPKILLFDEATSALDNRTQALVSESLEKLHATRVVIAHRLSTIINADRIYVMDKGQIVQMGNYKELLAQPGMFQDLARRQIVGEAE